MPFNQGFLGKVRPPRVSQDLRRGREAYSMDNRLIFLYWLISDGVTEKDSVSQALVVLGQAQRWCCRQIRNIFNIEA